MSDTKAKRMDVVCPYGVQWTDLSFAPPKPLIPCLPGRSVPLDSNGVPRNVLDGVTGCALPGEVVAIMGPSGSGKTTLLDLLADRVGQGAIGGKIEILGGNGTAPTDVDAGAKAVRGICSYVTQEDHLLGAFTVEQTLWHSAGLAMPWAGAEEREARVEEVIALMGLSACRGVAVGDVFRKGISGGQRRRLSIAIELLRAPAVMFLDEPTSGLDSAATVALLRHLKDLANRGHTIVLTIHQPSSRVVDLFSRLILLAAGRCAYCGPADDALSYFEQRGMQCPAHMNPSEYFMHFLSSDFGDTTEEDVVALLNDWAVHHNGAHHEPTPDALTTAKALADRGTVDVDSTTIATPAGIPAESPAEAAVCERRRRHVNPLLVFLRQLLFVSKRTVMNNVLNPAIFGVRLAMYAMLCIMVATMFIKTDDVAEINVMLFYVQAFLVFMSVAVLPFFEEQKAVFVRERSNGHVGVAPTVIATFVCGLPMLLVIAVVSTAIVVPIAGLNGFGWFFLNLFLSLVCAEALMHVIGAAQPHYIIGLAFGAGLFGMFMLVEGFMVRRDRIPGWWIWAHYSAFHSYSFSAFMKNQYGETMPQVLDAFDIPRDLSQGRNMGIIATFAAFFEIAFGFVLHFMHTGRR